jgi:hypothetical protein
MGVLPSCDAAMTDLLILLVSAHGEADFTCHTIVVQEWCQLRQDTVIPDYSARRGHVRCTRTIGMSVYAYKRFSTLLQGFRPRGGGRRGSAIVELALSLTLVLLLALGIVEYARAFYTSIQLGDAARAGARLAADTAASDATIRTAVQNAAAPLVPTSITVDRSVAGQIALSVTYDFTSTVPLISNLWGGGARRIHRTASARLPTP